MLSQTGMPMAPVDLQLLASLGTVNEDGSVTSDKADTFIVLLRWLIDTLKMNQSSATELLPQTDEQTKQILSAIFGKETDSIFEIKNSPSVYTDFSGTGSISLFLHFAHCACRPDPDLPVGDAAGPCQQR